MADLSPELSGMRERSGNEPELKGARPECPTCQQKMRRVGDGWKCNRLACLRQQYGSMAKRNTPVLRERLSSDPDWFEAGSTIPAAHIVNVRSGRHPMGNPLLGQEGATCGNCMHLAESHGSNTYFKCALMRREWTAGPGTDLRKKWAACNRWAGQTTESEG